MRRAAFHRVGQPLRTDAAAPRRRRRRRRRWETPRARAPARSTGQRAEPHARTARSATGARNDGRRTQAHTSTHARARVRTMGFTKFRNAPARAPPRNQRALPRARQRRASSRSAQAHHLKHVDHEQAERPQHGDDVHQSAARSRHHQDQPQRLPRRRQREATGVTTKSVATNSLAEPYRFAPWDAEYHVRDVLSRTAAESVMPIVNQWRSPATPRAARSRRRRTATATDRDRSRRRTSPRRSQNACRQRGGGGQEQVGARHPTPTA